MMILILRMLMFLILMRRMVVASWMHLKSIGGMMLSTWNYSLPKLYRHITTLDTRSFLSVVMGIKVLNVSNKELRSLSKLGLTIITWG
jgi:hypothetical protein